MFDKMSYWYETITVNVNFLGLDTNVMAGRTGGYDETKGIFSNVVYMPCTADNNFVPKIPKQHVDMIYICCPNNPTGTTLTREQLAKNDGLSLEEFKEWFKGYDLSQPMAIIHFTRFRY